LAKRAKSYSDFYEVATKYLSKEAKVEKTPDVLDSFLGRESDPAARPTFEDIEEELLAASYEEYQYES